MQSLKVSCMDMKAAARSSSCSGTARMERDHRLDRSDQSIVRPMVEASAAQYAKEKSIAPGLLEGEMMHERVSAVRNIEVIYDQSSWS